MSGFSTSGNATLGEIIDYLASLPPDMPVANGFRNPHSYRGYYEDLAFEPEENTTVKEMLDAARSALGTTYEGWKGGDYTMREHADCWLAERGTCGIPIVLPGHEPEVYVLPKK